MTTEEAKGFLQRRIDLIDSDYPGQTEYRDALEMAVKALEQERYYKDLAESYEKTINKLTNAIAEQEPKTEWISVSERLPKNRTYVLTTIHIPGRQPHARSGWYEDGLFMNDNGDTWKSSDVEVIGWIPLPEPYKESEG